MLIRQPLKLDRNRLEPAASRSEPLVRFQQERLGVVSHGVLCDHVRIVQKGCHSRATRAGRALEGERRGGELMRTSEAAAN